MALRTEKPIGIFDSGLGGLTVLKAIIKELPKENTIYLGDTARVPYGIRSPEAVIRYCVEAVEFLLGKRIKLLVIACNTSSAVALNTLRKRFPLPIIGVIEPGAKGAVGTSRNRRIGVIGTETTIRSGAYRHTIFQFDPRMEIIEQACPMFVPLVEEGWTDNGVALLAAKTYLSGMKKKNVDTLLLGCTHYPLLKPSIQKIMGSTVRLIDSAKETAKEVKDILKSNGILKKTVPAYHKFYVTDAPERFQRVGRRFLGEKLDKVEKVSIV